MRKFYLSFFWNTHVSEVNHLNAEADRLVAAAVKGGMSEDEAAKIVQELFDTGKAEGRCEESYDNRE